MFSSSIRSCCHVIYSYVRLTIRENMSEMISSTLLISRIKHSNSLVCLKASPVQQTAR